MVFLAYFSVLGMMAAMVFAITQVIEPRPPPTAARSLALTSSVNPRAAKTQPANKGAPQAPMRVARSAHEPVREPPFLASAGQDEMEQALASAEGVPLPVSAPPRPAEQIAAAEPGIAVGVTERQKVVPTASPKPRRAGLPRTSPQEVFRQVGIQGGVPIYVRVR